MNRSLVLAVVVNAATSKKVKSKNKKLSSGRKHITCGSTRQESFQTTLKRPLGLILQPQNDDKGAYVADISPRSHAADSGIISVGDIIDAIEINNVALTGCSGVYFDDIISFISTQKSVQVKLIFSRPEVFSTESNDMASYWEKKRNERLNSPAFLRRTVGVQPEDIRISKSGPLGEGSFGTVFRGTWKERDVVLKCAKRNVYGATELLDAELELNEAVHKLAKGSCARFFGCCEIDQRQEGQIYNGTLPAGLWLMWEYCGSVTLGEALRKPETLETVTRKAYNLSQSATECETIKLVLRSILKNLETLHSVGIVHRDIKPDNIIFSEGGGVVFIDLGAAAQCLGVPKNYVPGEGPADPRYCSADDIYLLPSTAPQPTTDNLSELWEIYQPGKFDMFSVGIIMLQLCFPYLRDSERLLTFKNEFARHCYDLSEWRAHDRVVVSSSCRGEALLDAAQGAGWALATALLTPKREDRINALDAMSHSFFD